MRHTETHVYFWEGPFSNWDSCHLTDVGSLKFLNSEQAFMWYKANFFKDKEICAHLSSPFMTPKEAKKLGRQIKGYNEKAWDCVRLGFMVYVNYLKFSQNPSHGQILKDTEQKTLVEASPYDKIWGVGLAENNDLILDEKNWLGQNLLGKALMEVRKML